MIARWPVFLNVHEDAGSLRNSGEIFYARRGDVREANLALGRGPEPDYKKDRQSRADHGDLQPRILEIEFAALASLSSPLGGLPARK